MPLINGEIESFWINNLSKVSCHNSCSRIRDRKKSQFVVEVSIETYRCKDTRDQIHVEIEDVIADTIVIVVGVVVVAVAVVFVVLKNNEVDRDDINRDDTK